jgi:GNAT superfamily N-acetyltransferase
MMLVELEGGGVRVERVSGAALARYIPDLARLRIEVFREFPYLYDGTLEHENEYLGTYARVPDSVIVLAIAGARVVGASTGLPMEAETDEIRRPFIARGYDPARVFYFGESVLERGYRGQGLGVRFFEQREAHARALARFDWTCFCAVERPADHPARPADYEPLDAFWQRRGYAKHPELRTEFSWREVGESRATPKPMVFWLKRMAAT